MGNQDLIETKHRYIMLDKIRPVKITLRSLLLLENMFGTITGAFQRFGCIENGEQLVLVIIRFLFATTGGGLTRDEIEKHLTSEKTIDAYKKIKEAIETDLPESRGATTHTDSNETYDWDSLYYIGRYRLQMRETEFWNCTPKRFWKLNHLWNLDHGLAEEEPKQVLIDQIMW